MLWLVLAVFFGNLLVNMLPAYFTFAQVRAVMEGLNDRPEVIAGGPRAVMNAISGQLTVEGIRAVTTRDFTLARGRRGDLELTVDYEVRRDLFGNVAVLMHFNHMVELHSR